MWSPEVRLLQEERSANAYPGLVFAPWPCNGPSLVNKLEAVVNQFLIKFCWVCMSMRHPCIYCIMLTKGWCNSGLQTSDARTNQLHAEVEREHVISARAEEDWGLRSQNSLIQEMNQKSYQQGWNRKPPKLSWGEMFTKPQTGHWFHCSGVLLHPLFVPRKTCSIVVMVTWLM